MHEFTLNAQPRSSVGKEKARKMRRDSQIPGVVYGHGKPAIPISVNAQDLLPLFKAGAKENIIITLKLAGDKQDHKAIIRDIQTEPIYNQLIHIDLQEILLTEKIKVPVHIELAGEAPGLKEGGIIEHILHSVEVSCLPADIPDKIVLDVSTLKLGQSLHISDIQADKFQVLGAATQPIVSVIVPRAMEEEATAATAAAPAEGEAPAEPELITRKKKEDEELDEAADKEKEKPKEKK
ncbi:MAG TPA: 50S ribosomal protein L25 [Candidatus Edwardsbacteria bacterium]|nr:50S ribosomal protein L25 [Candidatus Edwardsbacteria bacterium]